MISLTRLGIPLVETLSVLELVEQHLHKQKDKYPQDAVTTWHLREIVYKSLHRLNPSKYLRSDIEKWGDAYARRFGNPNNRISVVEDNGESEYLTFNYLTEVFIPDLVSQTMDMQFDQLRTDIISNNDIKRIADEILSVVQYMYIYEIQYDTLFKMASDIALNPPHPWMVNKVFDGSLIEYDLERANEHSNEMHTMFNEGDNPSARHRCMECLDHSCSALLGYYGVFMGVKPFQNLIRTLKLQEANPLLWRKLKIRQLEGDLSSLGQSLMNFQILLSKTNKLTGAYQGKKLQDFIIKVTQVHKIIVDVLEHRLKVEKRILQIKQLDALSKKDFELTTADVFASIPNLKKRQFVNEKKVSGFWFQHDIHVGGILHKIEPRLFIATIYSLSPISPGNLSIILDYFEDNRHLCNTVFVVSNNVFSPECQKLAIDETKPNDRNIILISIEDLQDLYFAENRVRKLGDIILDFYDRI